MITVELAATAAKAFESAVAVFALNSPVSPPHCDAVICTDAPELLAELLLGPNVITPEEGFAPVTIEEIRVNELAVAEVCAPELVQHMPG